MIRRAVVGLGLVAMLAAGSGAHAQTANELSRRGAEELSEAEHSPHRLQLLRAAIDDLEAALKANPNDWTAHHNLGEVAVETGKYPFAINEFSKAIALNPASGRSYMGRGNAYLWLHDDAQAMQNYRSAIHIDPALKPLVYKSETGIREQLRQQQVAEAQAAYARSHPAPQQNLMGNAFQRYTHHNESCYNHNTPYATCTDP